MLKDIEKNLKTFIMLDCLLMGSDGITATELMLNLKEGSYDYCQWLVPLLLMSSNDRAVNFTFQRLYYKLYADELERVGTEAMTLRIAGMLEEERGEH